MQYGTQRQASTGEIYEGITRQALEISSTFQDVKTKSDSISEKSEKISQLVAKIEDFVKHQ